MKKLSFQFVLALSMCLVLPRICRAGGNDNPTGVTGDFNGTITTGGSYDIYTGNAKRFVEDLTVAGSVGAYPLKWTRILNTRYGSGNADLGHSGSWVHAYRWGLWLRPTRSGYEDPPYEGPDGRVSYPDGRTMDLREADYRSYVQSYYGKPLGDRLEHMGNGNYDLVLADGGRVRFQHPTGSTSTYDLKATQIVDPYGQTTVLTYDATSGRLSRVTEPGGRYLQINYITYSYYRSWPYPGQWHYVDVISSVQAFAKAGLLTETVGYDYTWENVPPLEFYNLTQVNYDDGTHATYTYYPSNNGTFVPGRIHTCDDVRFAGPMSRIEYDYVTSADIGGPPDVGQIKREKNLTTHQVVSEAIYPQWQYSPALGDPTPYQRWEQRGDGSTRFFQYTIYGLAELASYTDFKGQPSYIDELYWGTTFTDARGNQTVNEKEAEIGAVTAVTRGNDPPDRYTYSDADNPHYLASSTDGRGAYAGDPAYTTFYDRDPDHRIWRTRYPDNSTEEFTYNNFGQVLTHKLTTGGTETFVYDTRGLKTLSWPPPTQSDPSPDQHPTVYTYYQPADGHPAWIDRLKSVKDPLNHYTLYEYNQRGQVTKVTHHDGNYIQSQYNLDGTLAWTADENHPGAASDPNQRTRYEYDEYKRVRKVTNPMGEMTENWYGLDSNWQNPLLHTTNCAKYTLSPMGKNVVYEYDANFRKTYQGVALGTADAAETRFDYDEVGNLTWTRDPRWNVTTFGYDQRNRKIWTDSPIASDRNSLGHTMNWEYDGVGNKLKETRADSAFRSWDYDSVNRLAHAIDWRMSSSETAITTTYTRDVQDLTEWITDAKGAVYTFTFDKLHRKTSETYPPAAGNPNPTEYYVYDVPGNLFQYYNPAGQIKTMSYDNRNRLTNSWWSGGGGPSITYSYDAASRMTSVVTGLSATTVAFGYDDANRKIWEDQTVAGYSTHRVMSDLDADGNRDNLQVPGVYLVHYDYTQRGQLSHIYQASGAVFFSYNYDAAGNMLKRKGEWGGINDSTNCEYDALNRPTIWEQTGTGDVPFARSHYQYDNVNREVATWRDGPQDEAGSKGERFSYYTNNQLWTAKYKADQVWTGTPLNASRATDYNYTPDMLNRQSVTDNGVTSNYSVNGLNQYSAIAGQTLGYDGNFNVAAYNGGTYTYDSANRLVSANNGSVQFTYDGLGRCVKRTVNGVASVFIFDGWKPMLEFDGAGNPQVWNIYGAGPDEILLRITNSSLLRYHSDRQGNVAFVLDGSGNGIERYTYDAFGQPTITEWNGNGRTQSAYGNRFMYTGREWIAELGIYDYRHRMYHPGLGRFLQTDPTGLQTEGEKLSAGQKALFSPGGSAPEAFSSSEMNLFRYCGDDPVDFTDAFGLEVQTSLEYYIMDGTMGRGHMNLVLHDTTTGETVIGRGQPSEPYGQAALRSLFDRPQKSETGNGNVKLRMDVNPGKKGVDPDTGNQTTTVSGSLATLKDDMKTATAKLREVAAQITDKKLDYRLQTVNSNSAAATAYNQVTGQAPPPASQQLPLPGSNLNVLTDGRFPSPPLRPHELSK